MSKSNTTLKQIYLPIYSDYYVLAKNISNIKARMTIMIPIDEKEEKIIDNIGDSILTFNRGNKTFSVSIKDIYCYGEVDFNDEDTLDKIETFNFLDFLESSGIHIYSRYDYNTHSCSTPKKRILWTETWSPVELAKMAHGYLGKPKRILLFNKTIK